MVGERELAEQPTAVTKRDGRQTCVYYKRDLTRVTLMVKRLSCLPSKQAAGVRLPFSVFLFLFFSDSYTDTL